MVRGPKGVKQYPFRPRIMARPFTLFAVWLYLTLLAKWLCDNGNFQTEGGGRALDLVVWSRLPLQTIFFLWLNDYMTITTRLDLNDYVAKDVAKVK
jgi:hypothetical protein